MNLVALLLRIPVVISLPLIGAHFLYRGNPVLMAASLSAGILLVVPRAWAARALQVVLIVAALEWVRTMSMLVGVYQTIGKDCGRMAAILSAVTAFTLLSVLVFRVPRMQRFHGHRPPRFGHRDELPGAKVGYVEAVAS
jgi:hypothetical protein